MDFLTLRVLEVKFHSGLKNRFSNFLIKAKRKVRILLIPPDPHPVRVSFFGSDAYRLAVPPDFLHSFL